MSMRASALSLPMALALLLAATGVVQAAGVDDGFDPDANGAIWAIEQQQNGQLLLGGQFTTIGGATRNHVARVNNDGGRSSFNPNVLSGTVNALHEQPGGSILIGGSFSTVSGQPRSNIARVNSAGTLDAGFDPVINGAVTEIASQLAPDGLSGYIYVAGYFDSVDGVPRTGIVRLHADGSVDTGFVPPVFNQIIFNVRIQPDGRVLVGGMDNLANNAPVARLNFDGSLDSSFSSTGWSLAIIQDIVLQPDGKILIAGSFNRVGEQDNIVRLQANGQLDAGFQPPEFNNIIYAMALQSDGRITVAGRFDNNIFRAKVARLYPDGSYDTSFNTLMDGSVYALAQQADGKYAIGGTFTQIGAYARNAIARLETSGAPDVDLLADLSDGPNSRANVLALQTDGKVLVGGQASGANRGLTRLGGNGLVDPSFSSSVNGVVSSLVAYPNGTILVAGQFTNVGQRVARLLNDGTIDGTFTASVDGNVNAAALQRNGSILLGGTFSNVGGLARPYLARLFNNGVADAGFSPALNGEVYTVTIQDDGKSLIGGNFTVVNGQAKPYLARLNTNGSLDTSFDADLDDPVRAIATDASGRILIGGSFASVDSTARIGIARLQADGDLDSTFVPPNFSANATVLTIAPMTNGRILVGGFSVGANTTGFIRRLSSNGSQEAEVDPDFETGSLVTSALVQPDGKVLFGGVFSNVDGRPRTNVARLAQIGSAIQSIYFDNKSDLRWARENNAPELIAAPQVVWSLTCCDPASFLPLASGIMSRTGNVWSLDGIPAMGENTVWLRAVSIAGDGGHGVGTIESPIIALQPGEPFDRLFADGFD
ncbi:hypothetical protein [Dokdonella sp.]|uniref:hypothetical protein n=1 Tax=Dokdonella sp. TaxID=2291710 RepID=UPI003C3C01B8